MLQDGKRGLKCVLQTTTIVYFKFWQWFSFHRKVFLEFFQGICWKGKGYVTWIPISTCDCFFVCVVGACSKHFYCNQWCLDTRQFSCVTLKKSLQSLFIINHCWLLLLPATLLPLQCHVRGTTLQNICETRIMCHTRNVWVNKKLVGPGKETYMLPGFNFPHVNSLLWVARESN